MIEGIFVEGLIYGIMGNRANLPLIKARTIISDVLAMTLWEERRNDQTKKHQYDFWRRNSQPESCRVILLPLSVQTDRAKLPSLILLAEYFRKYVMKDFKMMRYFCLNCIYYKMKQI